MKANDIKKGNVVEYNGGIYQIRDIERSSPQGRGGNVRFRFIMYSVPGGVKPTPASMPTTTCPTSNCCAGCPRSRTRTAKRSCSWTTKTSRLTRWMRT